MCYDPLLLHRVNIIIHMKYLPLFKIHFLYIDIIILYITIHYTYQGSLDMTLIFIDINFHCLCTVITFMLESCFALQITPVPFLLP